MSYWDIKQRCWKTFVDLTVRCRHWCTKTTIGSSVQQIQFDGWRMISDKWKIRWRYVKPRSQFCISFRLTRVKNLSFVFQAVISNMDSISTFSSDISVNLSDSRQKITKLSSVHSLLTKLQTLFELPTLLRKAIQMEAYPQVFKPRKIRFRY